MIAHWGFSWGEGTAKRGRLKTSPGRLFRIKPREGVSGGHPKERELVEECSLGGGGRRGKKNHLVKKNRQGGRGD